MENIKKQVEEIYERVVDIRRKIHQNPELSQNEFETQKLIMNVLESEGIECKKIADTGVLAIVHGNGNKTVGYRADIDALPITEQGDKPYKSKNQGVMHACGHDAHAAIALGTAILVNKNKDQLKGNVKFFFQPAEETVGGAERMVNEGCMENPKVSSVIGLHVMPHLEVGQIEIKYGTLNASTDTVTIKVKGRSGHGAYPHKSVDAIYIACQIVVTLQSIISRELDPTQAGVITFGKIEGGTKSNIIADEVKLVATVRASNHEMKQMFVKRIEEISKGIAVSLGGDCEILWSEDGYPPLVNDDDVVDVIKESSIETVGNENIVNRKEQSMGGEDFSFFIKDVKGAFYHVGCKVKDKEDYALHTVDFDIDENCMKIAIENNINIINKLLEKEW